MTDVAAYVRVSTQQQKDEGAHESQRDSIRSWAEQSGYNPDEDIEWYQDIAISGQADNRGEYSKLMERYDDYEIVVVRELSRFGRDPLTVLQDVEEIIDSKALNIPSYNQNPFIIWSSILQKYGLKATLRYFDQEHRTRREEFFEDLQEEPALLMAHFHRPDAFQDLFYKFTDEGKDERIEEIYEEMDELAGKIIQKAEEAGYDTILFMSDHGLPTETEHNENAFYSCNHELFPDKTPHITDFHDKILELTGTEESDVTGIEV